VGLVRKSVLPSEAASINGEGASTDQERADAIATHVQNYAHAPIAQPGTDDNKILFFNGSTYIWVDMALPPATDENQILKSDSNNEWKVVRADDPVEGLTVIALPYYWDEARQKFLDNQLVRVTFYENGTGKRRRYMNFIPEIRSDRVPFKIYQNESYCIVNAEYYTTDTNSGQVMEIRDMADSASALATVNLGSTPIDNFFIDTLNISLLEGVELAGYILNTKLDNPTLVLGLRKIWIP
jgi:hypothetical protein